MPLRIALVGNPNSGKTSLFNACTGASQHVGNYSGVTVDIKEGTIRRGGESITMIDLPGTYSLSAYSLEERVARDYIIETQPEVVINVIDASNLERNLYLTIQLMEMGIRPILAFNMWDEVAKRGISINTALLSKLLDAPIVTTVAKNETGIRELIDAAVQLAETHRTRKERLLTPLPVELDHAINEVSRLPEIAAIAKYSPRWIAGRLFEHDKQVQDIVTGVCKAETQKAIQDHEERIVALLHDDTENLIAEARYGYIAGALRETVTFTRAKKREVSDAIDGVLTHRFWAYPVFILFMWLLFQSTFVFGAEPMHWIELFCGWLKSVASSLLPDGLLKGLIVDGIINGVGGVIVFLPNILILFLGISIMEDTGYMARAAFIMDRFMHAMGLHGKSFIPMLMGMGCNVPAIMATRTLESRNDRIKTILLVPLISCSARLPIYILFAGALFPQQAGNIVFLFQFIFGTSAFFIMGVIFKHTLFKGEQFPFVMELPPYRLPTVKSTLIHMWQKAEHYLKKMGGVVLAFSIVLWVLGEFPKAPHIDSTYAEKIAEVTTDSKLSLPAQDSIITHLKLEQHAAHAEQTYIGRLGKTLEPFVAPLGFDWQAAVSLVTGFIAKEVVVGSMGVLYAVGDDATETNDALRMQISRHFTPLTGFAFMMFVLLYTPCVVALVTMFKELKSWKWGLFGLVYQLGLAWISAFAIFQVGKLLGFK